MRTCALLAVLLFLVCACRPEEPAAPDRDATLKQNLSTMRNAIDNFYQDHKRYPATLDELVPNYLRRIPPDPITESDKTWRVITEEPVQPNADFTTATTGTVRPRPGIVDVRSGAGGKYSEY